MVWIAAGFGGALGSVARHLVNIAAARAFGNPGPFATAIVNVIGSLCAGVLAGLLASQRISMTNVTRTFVFVGILGGFTTFSSLMLDSLTLLDSHSANHVLLNVGAQIVAGGLCVYAGYQYGLR
jgi:CrcB protein